MGARKKATTTEVGETTLHLRYSLAELPSSQHRAGLAGLVWMVRWLELQRGDKPGTCRVEDLTDRGVTLVVDKEGMKRLFDETYGASLEETASKTKRTKGTGEKIEPLRTVEREERTVVVRPAKAKKGMPAPSNPVEEIKIKKITEYIYPQVVPRGGPLPGLEIDPKKPFLKLWRDMVWQILRGVPAQREPFEGRAEGRESTDFAKVWSELQSDSEQSTELPSTYYLGAQARTGDNVPFKDRARFQLALHFWPYVVQIYIPQTINPTTGDKKFAGYALVVPDVAMLEMFADDLRELVAKKGQSETPMSAYYPRDAVVDLPAESALDVARRLRAHVEQRAGVVKWGDIVLGFDVFHMDKEGNNVRLKSAMRVEPTESMVIAYDRIRGLQLWDVIFRQQCLKNLLDERSWDFGFEQMFSTTPWARTIGALSFRHDARIKFESLRPKKEETIVDDHKHDEQDAVVASDEHSLESVVYQLMQGYVYGRLKSKYQLDWQSAKAKGPEGEKDFGDKKLKVAKDAFLGVRSRTGADYVAYFSGTLCSTFSVLPRDKFMIVAKALQHETDRIRTLTLLALSAIG